MVTRFLVYEHVILYMCKMQSYFTSFQGPTTMFAKINLGYKLALMANNSLIINKIILMTLLYNAYANIDLVKPGH